MEEPDLINSPPHMTEGGIEAIDVIEAKGHGEGYCAGNIMKYIMRYPFKGTPLNDLRKAQWYLTRLITIKEGENGV